MSIGVIIFAIVLICFFALFAKNRNKENAEIIKNDIEENNNIEEIFFNEVKNGKEKIVFLKIDNQFDLMFIKSLFQSVNIPYYVEFENISSMRPGMYIGDLGNYNLLYILEDDYYNAIDVVNNYLQTKKEHKNEDNKNKENARNLAEILFGNWKVPSADDTNGIEIIYKK